MEASVSEQDLSQNIELSADEQAQLKALDESLAKFEGLKRWSDVIKTLISKAELVKDPAEKVANYARAGELYIEKSSNQAEAIKCYARVLEIDRTNVEAITRLKDMYEKRRDWEKLVDVMRAEIELLDEADRPLRYVEVADLATQRLRKPEVCIELWRKVLEYDPANAEGDRSARGPLREGARVGTARRGARAPGRADQQSRPIWSTCCSSSAVCTATSSTTTAARCARSSACSSSVPTSVVLRSSSRSATQRCATGTRSRTSTRPRTSGTS